MDEEDGGFGTYVELGVWKGFLVTRRRFIWALRVHVNSMVLLRVPKMYVSRKL